MSLTSLQGKVVVLHFFTSFSTASQKQFSMLRQLHAQFGKRGIVILGLTVERSNEKLRELVTKYQLPYPILQDATEVFQEYKVGQIPDLCVIDRLGVMRSFYPGYHPGYEERFMAEVRALLKLPGLDGE